jgi:hypothetical protein
MEIVIRAFVSVEDIHGVERYMPLIFSFVRISFQSVSLFRKTIHYKMLHGRKDY